MYFRGFNSVLLDTDYVAYGSSATAPSIPSVTGYTSDGWDRSFNYITGTLTVYAVYNINYYNVYFYSWDGLYEWQYIEHGGAAYAPTDPTRSGYTFDGWDTSFSYVTSDLYIYATWVQNSGGWDWVFTDSNPSGPYGADEDLGSTPSGYTGYQWISENLSADNFQNGSAECYVTDTGMYEIYVSTYT